MEVYGTCMEHLSIRQLLILTWKCMEPVWNPYKKEIFWNPISISDLELYGTCMEPRSTINFLFLSWKCMKPLWNPYFHKHCMDPN